MSIDTIMGRSLGTLAVKEEDPKSKEDILYLRLLQVEIFKGMSRRQPRLKYCTRDLSRNHCLYPSLGVK